MIRVEYYWRTIEVKAEPEEIPDTEHELVLERVCAVDVAKDSGKVCVRVSSRAGRRVSKVWDVAARSGAVAELAEHLVDEGIEKVTVESTSDYWRIWFYVLEAAGLSVQLVNARDVKNVPGRPKTDKLDAVWLAKLTEKGLLRPSFCRPRRSESCGTTPAADRSDAGTFSLLAAVGEAARGRVDQGVGGGLDAGHAVGARHARGAHRRRA